MPVSDPATGFLETALLRLHDLSGFTEKGPGVTRSILSPAHREAAVRVMGWMAGSGMHVSHDKMGNLRGVLPGSHPGSSPLLLGSHLDSAREGGMFDGALGLVAALAAIDRLASGHTVLPVPVHLVVSGDSVGARFHASFLGARAVCGDLDASALALRDDGGVSLSGYLRDAGWEEDAAPFQYAPSSARGYAEIHLEQGRLLESRGLAAGVVTAISGHSRIVASLQGRSEHAGTTPMDLRRDALAGAAECILAIEATARDHPPLSATVGKLEAFPAGGGIIPGHARFTLDLHHPEDPARAGYLEKLRARCSSIARQRNLKLEWRILHDHDAVSCDPELGRRLTGALKATTGTAFEMPTGAGRDAMIYSKICPVAMLLVRCRDGISHHPDEFVSSEDLGVAIDVAYRFLRSFLVGS